jgi:hypothetical protein
LQRASRRRKTQGFRGKIGECGGGDFYRIELVAAGPGLGPLKSLSRAALRRWK